MIKLLNLDAPYLVTQRKNWLDELDQLIDEHLESDDSLEDLAAIDLLPTSGKLNPFFSATRQRFTGIAERLLQEHDYLSIPEVAVGTFFMKSRVDEFASVHFEISELIIKPSICLPHEILLIGVKTYCTPLKMLKLLSLL